MSVKNKLNAARKLSAILKQWPDDSHKVYNSFRNAQLKIYSVNTASELPSEETLNLRAKAANLLLENANMKKFPPHGSLLKPDGNPLYYELIMREANRKEAKSSIYKAVKDTVFGWWRKR